MFNTLLITPLYKLFVILLDYFKDPGVAVIIFSLITRVPLAPLYFVLHKEEDKLKKIQAKIKERSKGAKDFLKQAETASQVYREEKFNPFKNFLIQLSPLPILFAMLAVFNRLKIAQNSLIFLGLVDLKTPNIILALLTLALQFISLKNQPPETRKTAYILLSVIGIVLLTVPAIFIIYWIVILLWTLLEKKFFHLLERNQKDVEIA